VLDEGFELLRGHDELAVFSLEIWVGNTDGAREVDATIGYCFAGVDENEIWVIDAFGKPVCGDKHGALGIGVEICAHRMILRDDGVTVIGESLPMHYATTRGEAGVCVDEATKMLISIVGAATARVAGGHGRLGDVGDAA